MVTSAIMDIKKASAKLPRGLSFCYYLPSNISAKSVKCRCGNDCVFKDAVILGNNDMF